MNFLKLAAGAALGIGAVVCAPVALGVAAISPIAMGGMGLVTVGVAGAKAVESAIREDRDEKIRKETTVENSREFSKVMNDYKAETERNFRVQKEAHEREIKAKDDIIKSQDEIIEELSTDC